jgi:beta-lactamase class A
VFTQHSVRSTSCFGCKVTRFHVSLPRADVVVEICCSQTALAPVPAVASHLAPVPVESTSSRSILYTVQQILQRLTNSTAVHKYFGSSTHANVCLYLATIAFCAAVYPRLTLKARSQ